MMKSTGKGDETGTWSLHPCSEKKMKTLVLGSVPVDVPPSDKDSMGRLRRMVQDLEEMDAAWRGTLTSQPGHAEQILYMLILGRVTSDICLFHREKNTSHLSEEEAVGFIVKELSDRASGFGIALTGSSDLDIGGGDEADVDEANNAHFKLMSNWHQVWPLLELVEDVRDSISQGPTPEKSEAAQSVEIKIGGEEDARRVKTLRDILRELAERRRERSYAPPVDEELACYREIRKCVTSTVNFIDGKISWMTHWKEHLKQMGVAECGNHFLTERVRKGMGEWHGFNLTYRDSDLHFMHLSPTRHKIAVAFDELPELLSLLSDWSRRFSELTMRFLKGESMDVVVCTDGGAKVEVDVGKRARVRQEQQEEMKKKKKRKHSLFIVDDMFGHACKSRAQYLVHISSASLSMDIESSLSSREFRLYNRILEHVRSSIWLFHKRATYGEMQVYYKYLQRRYKKRKDKKKELDLSKYTLPLVYETGPLRGTREENLNEIVRMVEEMESSFLCSPLTVKEVIMYEKIEEHMYMDLMMSRCYWEVAGPDQHAYQVARCLLMDTMDMVMELARHLMKEFGDTLRLIFPGAPEDTELNKWFTEHKEDAASMLEELLTDSPLGLEYLDRALLSFHEVHTFFFHIVSKFADANWSTHDFVHIEKQYQAPILDCWAVLRGAEVSGFVKDGANTKL